MNNVQEAGNTIGNIPIKWYDKYDHIGYDLNGEKIMRQERSESWKLQPLKAVKVLRNDGEVSCLWHRMHGIP